MSEAPEKVEKGIPYPLADYYPTMEKRLPPDVGYTNSQIMAVWDGQPRRCPKKGEWFLSGAIIAAYQAKNDLTTKYHIARVGMVRKRVEVVFEPFDTSCGINR